MMIDDEPTMLRRDGFPAGLTPDAPEEATRAVDRGFEATRLPTAAGRERQYARPPVAVRTTAPGPGDRVAHVPGALAEASAYGVRREALTVPVDRTPAASAPVPASPAPQAAARRRRGAAWRVLAVVAFVILLAGAVVTLIVLVAS